MEPIWNLNGTKLKEPLKVEPLKVEPFRNLNWSIKTKMELNWNKIVIKNGTEMKPKWEQNGAILERLEVGTKSK